MGFCPPPPYSSLYVTTTGGKDPEISESLPVINLTTRDNVVYWKPKGKINNDLQRSRSASSLFICTIQSLCYMRVYHRCFLTPACVCVGGLEVGFFPACSWLALVAGVGGYVLTGVEIWVLSCIFLYFCGC